MMNARLLLIVMTVALARSLAAEAAPREAQEFAFQVDEGLRLDLRNLTGPGALTADEVTRLATASADYEAFLSALHARAPHLFDNHVLLHGTGSVQPASKRRPRVVLFGDGLYLAFAEDGASDARRVEVIAFDAARLAFSFRELVFAPGAAPRAVTDPKACAACHGSPGKPLWESYDFWPDAYGSAISRMKTRQESEAYKALMTDRARPGVYAYLDDHSLHEYDELRLPSIEAFTQYTASLNFLRIAGMLKTVQERYAPLRYALYAALERCHDGADGEAFLQNFPAATVASAARSYRAILDDTRATRRAYKRRLTDRYDVRFPGAEVVYDIDHDRLGREATIMAQVRFVLENAGVSLEGLTTSTGLNPWFMSTPSNFALDWLAAFLTIDRATLVSLGAGRVGDNWVKAGCETLRAKSLEALEGYAFPRQGATAAASLARQPPMGRCIACHASTDGLARGVPALPFDDTTALRAMLRARPGLDAAIRQRLRATDATRMPPRDVLSPAEIEALEAALDELR